MSFDLVFQSTLALEGGFVDDPNDSGGATIYGITERVARAHGYVGPMSMLPIETAKEIAKSQYWDVLRLDEVAEVSSGVAHELFDTGYNMGTGRAAQFFQRCLASLNRGGRDYADVTVDGAVGPMTIAAFRAYYKVRKDQGLEILLLALNCLQGAFYIELAERREKDEAFLYGWLKNRVSLQRGE